MAVNFAEHVPPQNLEAEQSVLGAMLIDRDAIAAVQNLLSADDFYSDKHQQLYQVMVDLHDRSEPVDAITVSAELKARDLLEQIGGGPYLAYLMNMVPATTNVEAYALIVEQKAVMRRLQRAARKIQEDAYQADDLDSMLSQAEQAIFAVTQRRISRGYEHVREALMTAFEHIEFLYGHKGQPTGVPTGFKVLDRMTNGLQPSDLIIVAARPSMGKTAFCLNIARNAATEGTTVGFFSLEMSREQLALRLLSAEAAVDQHRLRNGELDDEHWGRLTNGLAKLSNTPIYIDDTPNIQLVELRSRARRLQAEHELGLIIIDYLQLMSLPERRRQQGNRQEEISEISRSLKQLARELRCPIMALSQLSRAVESRQDKRPMLSDLRESGAIEQDADLVAFLYRDDYYDNDSEKKNVCEVILAKQRNGPVGSVELAFIKEIGKFFDPDRSGR